MAKAKTLRSQMLTCVGKICAYVACDKMEDARQWAVTLVQLLNANELYPINKPK